MTTNLRLREILHLEDPYRDFPVGRHPVDRQGWNGDLPIFGQLIRLLRPDLIIEFGSWKGSSAITMGHALRAAGIRGEIICVDTWLGSAEHVLAKPEYRVGMRYQWGYPQLYFTFLANVISEKLQDTITPFPNTTEVAYYVLSRLGVKARLIYVDASHEFPSVVRDTLSAWQLLTDDGVILGDDYDWPEVAEAVEVCRGKVSTPEKPVYFYKLSPKWILSRRPLPLVPT